MSEKLVKQRVSALIAFLVLFTLSSAQVCEAAASLSINDTTLKRGLVYKIPVYGTIDAPEADKIKFSVYFNALNIEILSAEGDANAAMKCPNPDFVKNLDNLEESFAEISCEDVQNVADGVVCYLNVEALAGPDTITYLTPAHLFINDEEITDAELDSAEIKILGDLINRKTPEGIGQNFENPFYFETTFPISLNKATKINLFIYTSEGRMVASHKEISEMIELEFTKNGAKIELTDLNQSLDKGRYELKLKPDNMKFASGEYYLVMITDYGVYSQNFIYLK